MLELLSDLIFYALYTSVGALWIFYAVNNFKDKNYFRFGVDVMLAAFEIACLAEMVFKG